METARTTQPPRPPRPAEARAPEPRTAVWRYFGDARNGLLGPPLLVLQVAHPVVGAGVLEHSNYREEPWPRLVRTFLSLSTIIYGGQAGATAEADRLRKVHATIRGVDVQGRRYHALNPDAYLWVLATLIRGGADGMTIFGRGLRPAELDEYYAQMRDVGRVLGLRDHHLPPDWDAFCAYYDGVVRDTLEDNQAVHDVLDSVSNPVKPSRLVPDVVWRPVARATGGLSYLVTVGTLPPVLRERFGLTWGEAEERRLRRVSRVVRGGMALVVPPMRIVIARSCARWVLFRAGTSRPALRAG